MALPPAFSIFCNALFEKACAVTVSFLVSSPSPRILIRCGWPRTRRTPRSAFSSTFAPTGKRSSSPTLRAVVSVGKGLRKPRFGRRRCIGVWPPWKCSLLMLPLERAFWPFCPRPDVLPRPEPTPRPMRLSLVTAPSGGESFERMSRMTLSFDLLHRYEVQDLLDHPAERRGVRHRDFRPEPAEPETLDDEQRRV